MHAVAAATAASSGPSPLWYATRGAGVAALLLLTASVVLGITTSVRLGTPRFVAASVHRNISLLAVIVLAAHIVTTILDPFAQISVGDAVVPFTAAYRPEWLGLGVVAAELLLAVTATSVLRQWIGPGLWRLVHWAVYASWPLAVVHGLGTGSDAQAPWMIGLTASCVTAVILALAARLSFGHPVTLPVRMIAGFAELAALVAIVTWSVRGPFQPGWTITSGTPDTMVGGAQAEATGPVHTGRGGFSDDLIGTMVRSRTGGTQIALRDVVDPGLTIAIRPPTSTETIPVMTIARDGRTICTSPTRVTSSFYAICGTTRLTVALAGGPTSVTGTLSTSGPLG